MSSAVEHIAQELRVLSVEDLHAVRHLVEELVASVPQKPEAYGEPLTDEDITAAARIAFASLDADESKT